MKIIEAETINGMAMQSWDYILSGGKSSNRNAITMGDIYVQYDVSLLLKNPRSRHLYLSGRKNNIFAVFGEIFWVMAGREDTSYLLNFIPRANDFSDDGKTWRAAYGARMYEYGQLQNLIDKFKTDGLYTRQAMLSLWHPEKDTADMLREKYDLSKTLDTPCNQWLQMWVDVNTNTLNMKVIQRSGDSIWGTLNINLPEFSVIHEMVLQFVQQMYPEAGVTLGTYHHSVTNFHIYEATAQQARDALAENADILFQPNSTPCVFPQNLNDTKLFFNDICDLIENGAIEDINFVFSKYGAPIDDNILYDYVLLTCNWIVAKREGHKFGNKKPIQWSRTLSSNDLEDAIKASPFRNFTFKD